MKRILTIVVSLAVLALLGWGGMKLYRYYNAPREKLVFKTEKISRGDLRSTISASGTIEPEELINVGAQVNGKIMAFGTDADGKTIDYGSRITAGTVLARIDDVLYEAEVRQAKASKLQAQAAIKSAEANIAVSKADLAEAAYSPADAAKMENCFSIDLHCGTATWTTRHTIGNEIVTIFTFHFFTLHLTQN